MGKLIIRRSPIQIQPLYQFHINNLNQFSSSMYQ
jgi:hypothetical protein